MPSNRPGSANALDRRQYLRHFLIIFTGNGAAQAANLLGYPILARLYSPQEFGLFGMFVAASAVPGMIACGRFEFAIPVVPASGVKHVLWLCILISSALGLISAGSAAAYLALGATKAALGLSLLFGLCVALTGICTASSFLLMRHEHYRVASASLLVRTGTTILAQIALALVAPAAFSLILGFSLGLVAQAGLLTIVIWSKLKPGLPKRQGMGAMFRRFRRQVTVDIPSTLLAALAANILTFALAVRYDARTVGFYSMGSRLAVVPLGLFNDSLSQVFFQKAARAREEKGHVWDELKFSVTISGLLSIGVFIGIVALAHPFIAVFLGRKWLPAADMLVVLAPMLAIRSLTMSVATTVFLLRSAHWLLIHNLATLILPVIGLAAATYYQASPIAFLGMVSGLLALEYAGFGLFLASRARRDRRAFAP